MRVHSILTGGTVLGGLAFAGLLLLPASESQAVDPPATLALTGTIRDFLPDANHPDFSLSGNAGLGEYNLNVLSYVNNSTKRPIYSASGRRVGQHWREGVTGNSNQISYCHYVEALDGAGNDGAHQGGTNNGGITNATTFQQWFADVPGINMSRLWTINLTWGNDSQWGDCWMFDTNNFNPIDNQLQGNDFDEKNFFFTYEIVARFTYDHDGNQFFWYKGDDDCWVFITSADGSVNQLVMDHGGVAGSREQTVFINSARPGLENMEDGQEYELRWFIAERRQPQSQFHVKTNVLFNTDEASDAVLAAYD
jgi:fibro-slime domain-containing protein